MSRNGSGTYTLPSGNPVISGTIIESTWANSTLGDIASALTDSLSRSGQGGMTAAFRAFDGTSSVPGISWGNETTTGFYRAGAGDMRLVVTGSEVMRYQSTGVAITGTLSATGAITATGGVVGNVTGNVSGNAGTVTNGVYTTGDQTIGGTKTFSNTISGSISGNAGTVTNGVYTTGNQDIGGTKTFTTGVVLNNEVNLQAKDTGGTARSLLRLNNGNNVLFCNAGNASILVRNQADTTTLVTLTDTSGNFTATGNVTAYSDERLKKDWADLPKDFIERLAKVKHGTYTRIDNGERQAGASAQAMREVLPESVMEGERLSLAYGNAALVAAIQLSQRVVELTARVEELEKKLGV